MLRIKTTASIGKVKPVPGRQVEYPIEGVPGLTLRVTSAGVKTWTLRYRTQQGEQRRFTLGRYPAMSLSEARGEAWSKLIQVTKGGDPAKEQRAQKSAARARMLSTVAILIEAYFEDAARGRHKPNARKKRQGTLDLERHYFDRLVKPRLGDRPVAELTRHEVQRFLDDIGEASPANARHCRALIRQAFNYGIRREVVGANPAQLTELPRPTSRDRVLRDDELRAVWAGANDATSVKGLHMSTATGLAICFAAVTLQRGGEVCGLHASEVDSVAKTWTIPGTRTKNYQTHVVPLSDLAISILDQAFALAAMREPKKKRCIQEWEGFAFPSPRGDRPITRHALSRAMKRLTTKLKIADATPHDLRRTGATNITGERIGIPRFIVSRVLNQISDTGGAAIATGVYDRNEYLSEKRQALEVWSDLLQEIVASQKRHARGIRSHKVTAPVGRTPRKSADPPQNGDELQRGQRHFRPANRPNGEF